MGLKSVKIAAVLWLVILTSWPILPAQAAEGQAYQLQSGDYTVAVAIEATVLKTGTDVPFSLKITAQDKAAVSKVAVMVEPFSGLSATPVKIAVKPTATNSWQGHLNFPVAGNWYLEVQLETPQGSQTVRQHLVAAPPPAIPDWVAWLLGCSPLLWFGIFFVVQGRQAQRKFKKALATNL